MQNTEKEVLREIPSIRQSLVFLGKTKLLQVWRGFQNLLSREIKSFPPVENFDEKPIIAESKTELWTEATQAEMPLLAGKVQNLRVALKYLNGIEIPANQTFSFWAQVGKATKRRGFVAGRELREGCIIPNIGGGLCQLSNALYDAALIADFEIIERHAHTQIVTGSLAEKGRDATVFWNYVDLQFRAPRAFRIEAELDATHLIVKFRSSEKKSNFVQIQRKSIQNPKSKIQNPNNCLSCGEVSCFRSVAPQENLDFGRTAFLVDEFSPEFDEFLQKTRTEKDVLLLPLDGTRFKKPNYGWTTKGFAKIKQSFLTTFIRAYKSRKLATQGAKRQLNLLASAEKLAASYAKNLTFDCTHLVISQNLLPFLWKAGVLGGRSFDVLMTNLPMKALQERLDFAKSLHAESPTLGDFRAQELLIKAETAALKHAAKIITPHSEIALIFAEKAELLTWKLPKSNNIMHRQNAKKTIVFPVSTVGRKGCYELREAVRGLDVKIIGCGAQLEGANFWAGFDFETRKFDDELLAKADLIVLPSFVETKPRRLLSAIANQIPVIATTACGLQNVAGVINIETGRVEKLREEIEKTLIKLSANKPINAGFAKIQV